MLDPHGALVYTMVLVSGAETSMGDTELAIIGDIIGHLPVFRGFDRKKLGHLNDCAELLSGENGLEKTLAAIKAALPERLGETAYAIACDLVASDGEATQEELQILELIRHRLQVGRLTAAAIERSARAGRSKCSGYQARQHIRAAYGASPLPHPATRSTVVGWPGGERAGNAEFIHSNGGSDTAGTLEDRIREIDDRLEIYNLIASHPPSARTRVRDHVALALDRGRRVRPRRRVQRPGPPARNGRRDGQSRASPRHRAGPRPFRRAALRSFFFTSPRTPTCRISRAGSLPLDAHVGAGA